MSKSLFIIFTIHISSLNAIKYPYKSFLLPANPEKAILTLPGASLSSEYGSFYQGDIKLLAEQRHIIKDKSPIGDRTGIINAFFHWPKNSKGTVTVPYVIDYKSKFSYDERKMIRAAMNDIELYTCIRFLPRTYERDFVEIISDRGCWSNIGKIGQKQQLSLQKGGCFYRGIIMHELIHALGYDHMQNHPDRDKYVIILDSNIAPGEQSNFDKDDPRIFSNFGTPYDYDSLMHYGTNAFSKNGKDTILVKNSAYRDRVGQRYWLSPGDVQRIKNMYHC